MPGAAFFGFRQFRPAAGIEPGSPTAEGPCPARRGGDLGSHRKPAGAAPFRLGLPVKARLPPPKKRAKNACLRTAFQAVAQYDKGQYHR